MKEFTEKSPHVETMGPTSCKLAQWKRTWTSQETHFLKKDVKCRTPAPDFVSLRGQNARTCQQVISRENFEQKCRRPRSGRNGVPHFESTWTSQEEHYYMREFTAKMPVPKIWIHTGVDCPTVSSQAASIG